MYSLLDCCCMKATRYWTAAVWILVVAGWMLVATGILFAGWLLVAARKLLAGWLLVADGILLVATGVLVDRWILVGARVLVVEFWQSLLKSRFKIFSLRREVNFVTFCKMETENIFGQNLFWQSEVKRRERFWLWATFRKAGKWEWMMLAALEVGSRMKLCRHTTWLSCSHWERSHEVMSSYHVIRQLNGHVTMQAWCMSAFENWAIRPEPRCNTVEFLLFLPQCNSNPFSFFFY